MIWIYETKIDKIIKINKLKLDLIESDSKLLIALRCLARN